jgi:hypothetical protein
MTLRPAVPAARALATTRRVVEAGDRLERDALAGVVAHPTLKAILAELTPQHFHAPVNRAVQAHLVDGVELDIEAIARLAELDARAEAEGIDKETAEELLLLLRERELRAELQSADFDRTKELHEALRRVQDAIAGFRSSASVAD